MRVATRPGGLSLLRGGAVVAHRRLRRAGISTAAAELLLARMQAKIDDLCAQRERLKKADAGAVKGRVLGGRSW